MLHKLFACMILRNEAHNLHRCLKSIRELCDEIIVVDTGSTDDTVKICREYGAIVYPSPSMNWRKPPIWDFSFARNESLQYCEELGADWMLVIDGDESLAPLSASVEEFKIKLTKVRPDVHALGTRVHEIKDGELKFSWWGTRFFKANKGVHYEGICHNRPKLIGAYAAGTDIVLYHHGYIDREVMDPKRVRTLTLLEKRLNQNPDDYEAYYYKCLTLLGMDKYDDGIQAGEKALQMLNDKINGDHNRLNYFGALYYSIGWAYFRKWKKTYNQEFADRAYQWWVTGWEFWPDDIDLNYSLCNIGYLGNNLKMVRLHGDAYLKAIDKFKKELVMPLDRFENNLHIEDLALGSRHIHLATSYHETVIKNMMSEMEKQEAA